MDPQQNQRDGKPCSFHGSFSIEWSTTNDPQQCASSHYLTTNVANHESRMRNLYSICMFLKGIIKNPLGVPISRILSHVLHLHCHIVSQTRCSNAFSWMKMFKFVTGIHVYDVQRLYVLSKLHRFHLTRKRISYNFVSVMYLDNIRFGTLPGFVLTERRAPCLHL